ncbi:MAG: UbiD family decarboxylase [Betaproteobacteria bacterium]|nr:UbiD family decarboxylase [Betaproteobacteria bacterium]
MAYYKDIREYLEVLDKNGKLRRIRRLINKDTELSPLVRLQFLSLPEAQRTAFLFDNITDVSGKRYSGSVLLGALGGSEEIYSLAMMCKPEEIQERRAQAERNPIKPRLVEYGPVHEEVHMGDTLLEHGGLDEFPVPISTPGYDPSPAFTAPCWVTKDPDSGIRNVGNYRVLIKSQTKTGIDFCRPTRGVAIHWNKAREKGQPLPGAIVIGGPPSIGISAVVDFPIDVDEFTMAGAMAGEPLELVKCKTVDLEVPAHAEIVIEGLIDTSVLEKEGPFGESIGYMSLTQPRPYFKVTGITHRKNPVVLGFVSQFQPSESSKIKMLGNAASVYKHLRYVAGFNKVQKVAFSETSDSIALMVVQVKDTNTEEVWKILEAAQKHRFDSKIIVAVNDDIDPNNFQSLVWALSTRFQPYRDLRVLKRPCIGLTDVSLAPMEVMERAREEYNPELPTQSYLLIDATIKWPLPPVSLPKKEFMVRAAQIWKEEGLPPITLSEPYHGRNLGYWHAEDEQKAEWALKGEYKKTGELQATQQIPGGPHYPLPPDFVKK